VPVAAVKLDRSFISTIERSSGAQAVVRAAIEMSHALGKYVVAEGVEQPGQLALLSSMGCDIAQGFHLSQPEPAALFAEFVRQRALPVSTGTSS
jgi:EAL domain-containing protein (putative c-di-GMP-specific phosphodiesterase class I)